MPMLLGFIIDGTDRQRSQDTIISLESHEKTALVLQIDTQKHLHYTYQGAKLNDQSDYSAITTVERSTADYTGMYNSVYTPSGSRNLLEPVITVTHADGNQSLDLRYVSHYIG